MADDVPGQGRMEKHIRSIITWDHVNEPGIRLATKYHTPTLEAYARDDDLVITPEVLQMAARHNVPAGLESDEHVTRVMTDLGWTKIEVANGWMEW